MAVIRAEHLVKEFTRRPPVQGRLAEMRQFFSAKTQTARAVDDVSLEVDRGEIVGYLGPNGAGKSTTIKMLSGILVPTSGLVEVNGIVPWKDRRANARNIGVVFGQRTQLWTDLPLRESFDLVRRLYGMDYADYRRSLDAFVDLLDMSSFMDTQVRSLSLGQRMRGDIVAAMLYRPPVIFLDEPTVGLDVVAKARIREFIAEQNRNTGTTVLLTTHDIADVEHLARRVVIIDHGSVLYDGGLEALRRSYAPYRELVVQTNADPGGTTVEGVELVKCGETSDRKASGGVVQATFRFDPSRLSAPEAIARLTGALSILDITSREPPVEEIIRQIYEAGGVTLSSSSAS